uniref:ATP synthase subunit s-like protein n=1 Tax=Syphacia muris TaxID=451379 RepID=A0A0N5A9C0_9BILA
MANSEVLFAVRGSIIGCSLKAFTSDFLQTRNLGRFYGWSQFKRWQELAKDEKELHDENETLKNFIRFPNGMYLTPEKPSDILPQKPLAEQGRKELGVFPLELYAKHQQLRYIDHSFDNMRRYMRYEHFQHLQYDQRFIPERHLFLGPDLAAAYFLVHRGAAVKFVGDDVWIKRNKWGRYKLPPRRVPDLYLEAVDASGTELLFEGFDNLADLEHLRLLRLASCPFVNDWMLCRIGTMFSHTLEMLDLSGCGRITAKGLAGLKEMKKLRYLRLEGLDHIKDIAKTALLLESSIPGLTVLGLDYERALKMLKQETMLLENERVYIDAKGNVHAEDDNGRLFYIAGRVNERPAVCDDDKPLMTSLVRREIPAMDDLEFERLDRLSGGKLRHLLVGSPSGYSWNEQVETILAFEEKWKSKKGIPVNNKMLPISKRQIKLPKEEIDVKKLVADENKVELLERSEDKSKNETHLLR